MPVEFRIRRHQMTDLWIKVLESGDYEIDLGSAWEPLLLREKLGVAGERRTRLRFGVTDRVGYELLQRPMQRTVLFRHKVTKATLANTKRGKDRAVAPKKGETFPAFEDSFEFSYEPVPIETVLWDGQGSSTSAQADFQIPEAEERKNLKVEIRGGVRPFRRTPNNAKKPGADVKKK